jgi:hypothetical protein
MSDNLLPSAPPVPQEYFRVLTAGLKAFGDVQALRGLLSDRLDFTGSIAGHVPDAKEGFLQGVIGFIGTVRGIDIIRDVHDDAGSAVLYQGRPLTAAARPSSCTHRSEGGLFPANLLLLPGILGFGTHPLDRRRR